MLVDDDKHVLFVDVDEPGWATTHADWMRKPGWWLLRRKVNSAVVLAVRVNDGDQPYYVARHVGFASTTVTSEVTAYGVGKKCADGSMVRLWVMSDGVVVGGEDVDDLGLLHAKAQSQR
jgi:hypothetical protein